MADAPGFLAIGHVARDRDPDGDGFVIGGTAAYSALVASRLGLKVAMVTSFGPDCRLPSEFRGIEVSVVPSSTTTAFTNLYSRDKRRQWVESVAALIEVDHIPDTWRRVPIVHIGPIAQEVALEVVGLLPDSLVCISPQGWLRSWGRDGEVRLTEWKGAEIVLRKADVLVLSENDLVAQPKAEQMYAEQVPVAIVTRGSQGARVYVNGTCRQIPAAPAVEVDPTGAGDVFAAAFAIRYWEIREPLEASAFAACAASFAVEWPGTSSIPTREQIEGRLSRFDSAARRAAPNSLPP
ncbi:MAG: PfkB family carbohydrate kinase [Dehalococcoidia bacterium]